MQNSKSQASTTANSSTKDELNPSSPTCTKPMLADVLSRIILNNKK
mgnify:CR=1 FL=1